MAKKETNAGAAEAQQVQQAKWSFATKEPVFDPARNMLNPPMEITRGMIRVIRMIDESVIVHGRPISLMNTTLTDQNQSSHSSQAGATGKGKGDDDV